MTQQEMQAQIERDVRITIGDLQIQLIAARVQIAGLEAQLQALTDLKIPPISKANGRAEANP